MTLLSQSLCLPPIIMGYSSQRLHLKRVANDACGVRRCMRRMEYDVGEEHGGWSLEGRLCQQDPKGEMKKKWKGADAWSCTERNRGGNNPAPRGGGVVKLP
jgi:hypothetical protein